MKRKIKFRPNSIYKDELNQIFADVIPIVEEFYKKRDIKVTTIRYDYTTDLVSFDFDEPKGYYPRFFFYIASSDKGVRRPAGRPFVATFAMMGVSQSYQFELREKYGIFPQIAVADGSGEGTTTEKLKYIFDRAADRLDAWDGYMALSDIFLF